MSEMHPSEERLNDYVDRLVPAGEREELEAHLERCAACRREVEAIRSLLASAAALPGAIDPPSDLWDDVADRTIRRRSAIRSALWDARYPLAAAALLLVMLSAGGTLLLMDGRGDGPAAVATTEASVGQVALTGAYEVEREYGAAVEELYRVFLARRDELDPETVTVVEESLEIIDLAIRTARQALEMDPANERIPHLLASTYRQKIDVLERTLRLSQS